MDFKIIFLSPVDSNLSNYRLVLFLNLLIILPIDKVLSIGIYFSYIDYDKNSIIYILYMWIQVYSQFPMPNIH